MQFLESLSQTALILWVAESNYGYPIVLTLHSLGMALVVGIMLVVDLRVLGLAKTISFFLLQRFFLFAWIGLAINAGSGLLLFFANYSAFLTNTAFITKVIMLTIGAIATALLSKTISAAGENSESVLTYSMQAKAIAAFCIVMWLGAITAGRIVGYTSIPM